jgi:hypothetical protein
MMRSQPYRAILGIPRMKILGIVSMSETEGDEEVFTRGYSGGVTMIFEADKTICITCFDM